MLVYILHSIAGAASGIGKATCQILARDGATVIAADINMSNVTDMVSALPAGHSQHSSVEMDISNSESVHKALKQIVEKYKGPPSIIVNSAGILRRVDLVTFSLPAYNRVMDINLKVLNSFWYD